MKKLVLSTLFVLHAFFVFAQQPTGISGKVLDAKTQNPLRNVVASIQNTNLTQLTDAEGKFIFKDVAVGSQLLKIKSDGYKEQLLAIEIVKNQILDLGIVVLEEDLISTEQQMSLITITESDLGDDNSGSESTSGLLQATRDPYQQAAAFNWGQARFRVRGLDNEYGTTMINGIAMNKIYDGRPQWGNWGGLNDATRNQEFTMGSAPSDYTFGNILGTQEINTRASIYRPGTRISFAGTNTNYNWRMMGTHASGVNKDGWAYVLSAGRRWAQEGYFDGTNYSANSFFASVEKKIGEKHALNFTSVFAQNHRGKTSPNTQEVIDLKGHKYNSYWGYQDGEKRNGRFKDIEEPILMLSHYWKINGKNNLNTNVSYQTGKIGNSRLDYQLGNNPDPTYYRNLPSYALNYYTSQGVWLPNYTAANDLKNNFLNDGQINWDEMYRSNRTSSNQPGRSIFVLYEDRTDDDLIAANSVLNSNLSDNISLNAAVNFKKLKSHNFANLLDLLGGQYFDDRDYFAEDGQSQDSDLNNPNRKVVEGETYGYNYNLNALVFDAFTQFKFSYKKADFYLAQSFARSEYQREGLYKNGFYPTNSFGKSEKLVFENFGFKGGFTYKITGAHLLDFNGLYMTKAPSLRSTFANARINNNITPDLTSESIFSADASYIIRMPKLKARLTAFMSKIQNSTDLSFYYAEGIGEDDGDADSFVSEIVTGLDKKNIGAEFGLEYAITSTIKATIAASYGEYTYDNNPNLKINDDALATSSNPYPVTDFGKTYLKGYRQPGMPQTAGSFGLEYRDPHFWSISANINYLGESYMDVSNIMRTNNFSIDSSTGVSYLGANESSVRQILQQEKFDDITLLNLSGGKSWRIGKNTIGFFASVNNVLDKVYKTGGFEQSRKATFPDAQLDNAHGTPSFGPKYFFGYGRTYFVNLYINL
jgi:hypothetical protein